MNSATGAYIHTFEGGITTKSSKLNDKNNLINIEE